MKFKILFILILFPLFMGMLQEGSEEPLDLPYKPDETYEEKNEIVVEELPEPEKKTFVGLEEIKERILFIPSQSPETYGAPTPSF